MLRLFYFQKVIICKEVNKHVQKAKRALDEKWVDQSGGMVPKNAAVPIRQSRKRSLYAEEQQSVMAVRFPPVGSSAGVITVNVCVQDLKN